MSDPRDIAAIVLAAGSSCRFGSDKLLHPVARQGAMLPLAVHSLLPWLRIFERITVVVRPGADVRRAAITASLGAVSSAALRWVVCEGAEQGMAESLACGVRANSEAAGWLIGLSDMPAVPSHAIEAVRDELRNGAHLAATSCNDRRGHPVGFGRRYYDELLALQGDGGARRLLERDRSDLVPVEIADNGIFTDIDTPRDLRSLHDGDTGGVDVMSTDMTRRRFLKAAGSALALLPITAITPASAATNPMLRAEFKYQDRQKDGMSCTTCLEFIPGKTERDPGQCKVIPGDDEISPNGYCTKWNTM